MKKQIITGILVFLAVVLVVLANPILNPISNTSVNENATKEITITSSAPDNGASEFRLASGAPSWASISKIDNTSAKITFAPGYDVVTGTATEKVFTITAQARDDDGEWDDEEFNVTVNNENRDPVLEDSQSIKVNAWQESAEKSISASDPDTGDTLTYDVTSYDSAKITCEITSSKLKVTRVNDWYGDTTCTVKVTDSFNAYDEKDIAVSVKEISKLRIDDLKVYVNGDKEGIGEDDIDEVMSIKDVPPDGEIEIKIKLENTFTDEEDLDIEDIDIEGVLESVDDGEDEDDIEEETSIDKIKPEDDETISLVFNIPLKVVARDYDLKVYIDGDDDNGTRHSLTLEFEVSVEKEKHEIAIVEASASPSVIKAGQSVSFDVEIINIGENNEDEVKIVIENDDLNLKASESHIELDEDPDEDDNDYEQTFTIEFPEDTAPGDYIFDVKVYHDLDDLDNTERITITVEEPAQAQPAEEELEVQTMTSEETGMLTQTTTDTGITQTTEGESFTESKLFIGLLIVGIVVVIVLIVLLLMLAFRRY